MNFTRILPAVALVGTALALGGCATKGDIDSLRSEIASVKAMAMSADAKATQAEADAKAAAESASMSSMKADKMMHSNMKK